MIADKIKMLREKRGMTQAELAEKAGLSDRTYADIERGNVNMRIETLLRICDALHRFCPTARLSLPAPLASILPFF